MNVYTHIAMEDLVRDIEAMPSVMGAFDNEPPAQIENQLVEETNSVPAELSALADNWSDLPEHIRQATATLTKVVHILAFSLGGGSGGQRGADFPLRQ